MGLSPDVRIDGVEQPAKVGSPAEERVVLLNHETKVIDLSGWSLHDEVGHHFSLPNGTAVAGNDHLNVWTKAGRSTRDSLYLGRRAAIWNNTGDIATLRNPDGVVVHRYAYGDRAAEHEPYSDVHDEDLARRVAPIFHFHPKESYFPASIDWYLDRCSLFYKGRRIETSLDPDALGRSSTGLTVDRELNLKLKADRSRFGQELGESPVYARTIRRESLGPDVIDVQFWVFYAYSGDITGAPFHFAHEGDWEHVTVRTRGEEPIGVYTSAHEASEHRWHFPADVGWTDGHPEVYVANDSHAAYSRAGEQFRNALPPDYTSDNGPDFAVADSLIMLTPELPWLSFNGLWGPRGVASVVGETFTSGPEGPRFKKLWYGAEHGPPGWICCFEDDGCTGDLVVWVSDRPGQVLRKGQFTNDEIRSVKLFQVRAGTSMELFNADDGEVSKGRARITIKQPLRNVSVKRIDKRHVDTDVSVTITGDEIAGKVSRIQVT